MSSPLHICPVVRGVWFAAKENPGFRTSLLESFDEIQKPCVEGAAALLGATVPLPYLSFFRRSGDRWVYFDEPLKNILNVFEQLKRPLVFQLSCNHLIGPSPLVRDLLADPVNLMHFADGEPPHDDYLGLRVWPLTLVPDPDLPINRYRFIGLRRTLSILRNFHSRTRLVLGVTLYGEAHHLYADFKDGGGAEGNVKITDYSPASIRGFRRWLAVRYDDSLTLLNHQLESRFTDWEDIQPPRSGAPNSTLSCLDSYSHGMIPVEGWCSPMEELAAVEVWLDDYFAGRAKLKMSRPDVPENIHEISDLNTGFKLQLDFRTLSEGRHLLSVFAITHDGRVAQIGERRIRILCADKRAFTRSAPTCIQERGRPPKETYHHRLKFYLDSPSGNLEVIYNPLADLWYRYRCYQVESMLETMWGHAVETGFPSESLFSHQIMIPFFGRRSELLYATDATMRPQSRYNPGASLYGGQTVNPQIPALFHNRRYAVTEFHPLSASDPQVHSNALHLHQAAGACWVAPYFLSPRPPQRDDLAHRRFWIHSSNPHYGSDSLFRAIQQMCTR